MKLTLITLASCCMLSSAAIAQPPSAPGQLPPPVSPWLNLNRRGNSPASNYFNLVQPQFNAINSINNLQQFDAFTQAAISEQQQQQQTQSAPRTTGHVATFNNLSHFYPRFNSSGRAGQGGMPTRR